MNTKDYKFVGVGLAGVAKRSAHYKFEEYREHYHLTQYSDLQLLEDLVYNEYCADELKKKMIKVEAKYKKEDKEFTTPTYLISSMKTLMDQILLIKDKLGMFSDKKNKDGFDYVQLLKDKFKKWEEENQGSRTFVCPHCAKMLMLHVKPDVWEVQEHKFFRDKILTNDHLIKLYKDQKITKTDCAKILGVSSAYIDWLIQKWFSNA